MAALSLPHPLPTRHACEVPSVLQALCEKLQAFQRGSRLLRPSQGGSRPSTHSGICQLRPGPHLRTHQRLLQTLSALTSVCCTPSFPRPSARLCPPVRFPLCVFLLSLETAGGHAGLLAPVPPKVPRSVVAGPGADLGGPRDPSPGASRPRGQAGPRRPAERSLLLLCDPRDGWALPASRCAERGQMREPLGRALSAVLKEARPPPAPHDLPPHLPRSRALRPPHPRLSLGGSLGQLRPELQSCLEAEDSPQAGAPPCSSCSFPLADSRKHRPGRRPSGPSRPPVQAPAEALTPGTALLNCCFGPEELSALVASPTCNAPRSQAAATSHSPGAA